MYSTYTDVHVLHTCTYTLYHVHVHVEWTFLPKLLYYTVECP